MSHVPRDLQLTYVGARQGPKIEKFKILKFSKIFDWKFQASHPPKPLFSVGNSEVRDWNFQSRLKILVDVSDIFYFFCPGRKGEVRGAGRRGALLKIPGGGGVSRRRAEGPGGSLRQIGEFGEGGGAKYFFSGPKCPPRDFKRDWKFQARLNFFNLWALRVGGRPTTYASKKGSEKRGFRSGVSRRSLKRPVWECDTVKVLVSL